MVPDGHEQFAGHARCGTKIMNRRSGRRSASCNSVLMKGAGAAGQDGVTFGDPPKVVAKSMILSIWTTVVIVEIPHEVLDGICGSGSLKPFFVEPWGVTWCHAVRSSGSLEPFSPAPPRAGGHPNISVMLGLFCAESPGPRSRLVGPCCKKEHQ